MSGLTTAAANRLIDAANATTALTAAVAPEKVRLTTTNPTAAAAGTEATGGSYVSGGQTIAYGAASAAAASNSGIITYSGMPAITVNGIDIFDAAGTPFRWWWASSVSGFTAKTTNAGDTLSFAAAAIVESITS